MATVIRPPFWVPRPSDDFIWQMPNEWMNAAVIQQLTAVKFYGRPGQAPTKRWAPYLTYNVAESQWNAAPIDSPIIAYLTKQKMYGAGGQVPTKRWAPYLTIDDPPMWQSEPVNSALLQLLTSVASSPFAPIIWNVKPEDAPIWQGEPVTVPIQLRTQYVTYGPSGLTTEFVADDSPPWQQPTQRNAPLHLVVASPFAPIRWNYNLDDAPMWQGEPFNSAPLQLLTNIVFPLFTPYLWRLQYTQNDPPVWQGAPILRNAPLYLNEPFENRQTYWYSEDSAWSGTPVRSATLSMLSTGQVKPFRWNATLDDPPSWQQPAQRNAPLNAPTGTPTVPVFWNVSPVDDPPWSWQWWVPINLNPVPIEFISNARMRWNFYDDAPSWQQPRGFNQVINTTFGNPVTSRPAPFFSEDAVWSGAPLRSDTLAMLSAGGQVKPFRWNWGIDDPPSWQQPKGFNQSLNTAVSNPFVSRVPIWYSDDPPNWQRQPARSNTLSLLTIGGQVKPFRWNYGLDDPPSWQQPKGFNLTLNTGVANPFTSRPPVWYSEDAFWSARLARSNTLSLLTAGGIRKAKLWRWDFDVGESFWQGAPVGYVIDLPVTGKPKTLPWFSYWAHAHFDIDAPGWVGAPRNAANTVNPIPPPPVRRFTPMIMRLGRLSHSIRR